MQSHFWELQRKGVETYGVFLRRSCKRDDRMRWLSCGVLSREVSTRLERREPWLGWSFSGSWAVSGQVTPVWSRHMSFAIAGGCVGGGGALNGRCIRNPKNASNKQRDTRPTYPA